GARRGGYAAYRGAGCGAPDSNFVIGARGREQGSFGGVLDVRQRLRVATEVVRETPVASPDARDAVSVRCRDRRRIGRERDSGHGGWGPERVAARAVGAVPRDERPSGGGGDYVAADRDRRRRPGRMDAE